MNTCLKTSTNKAMLIGAQRQAVELLMADMTDGEDEVWPLTGGRGGLTWQVN